MRFTPSVGISFVPDGTAVVVQYGLEETTSVVRWLPVDGSEPTELAAGSAQGVVVQRLAP